MGFDGILTLDLLENQASRQRAGFPVESDYAGAVIVLDSDPRAEALETRQKAAAVLRALAGETGS